MYRIFSLISVSILLLSCNDYQKLLNSTENQSEKYAAAEEYYNNGDFRRANTLIEQIIPSYRGKPQGERLVYFFANSYFETKLYLSAAIQFENFIKSYPNSQRIQEAYFMEAKSYYMLSPRYTLDQEETYTGIDKFQIFINRFPNSEYLAEALELVEDLQNKLEKKEFEIAINSIESRIVDRVTELERSLDNFLRNYPDTIFIEDLSKKINIAKQLL
jgi:outer membrane protein assembly factor BamD